MAVFLAAPLQQCSGRRYHCLCLVGRQHAWSRAAFLRFHFRSGCVRHVLLVRSRIVRSLHYPALPRAPARRCQVGEQVPEIIRKHIPGKGQEILVCLLSIFWNWRCPDFTVMENREMRTHFFHFLLAGPAFPVYIPSTSRTDSSVVERLSYTQLVGGSNPSPCTINKPCKFKGLRGFLLRRHYHHAVFRFPFPF